LTFTNSPLVDETKPFINGHVDQRINPSFLSHQLGNNVVQTPSNLSHSSFWNDQNVVDEAFTNENWDDLRSVIQFTIDPSKVYDCKDFN
jgi:hypothetical protein